MCVCVENYGSKKLDGKTRRQDGRVQEEVPALCKRWSG